MKTKIEQIRKLSNKQNKLRTNLETVTVINKMITHNNITTTIRKRITTTKRTITTIMK